MMGAQDTRRLASFLKLCFRDTLVSQFAKEYEENSSKIPDTVLRPILDRMCSVNSEFQNAKTMFRFLAKCAMPKFGGAQERVLTYKLRIFEALEQELGEYRDHLKDRIKLKYCLSTIIRGIEPQPLQKYFLTAEANEKKFMESFGDFFGEMMTHASRLENSGVFQDFKHLEYSRDRSRSPAISFRQTTSNRRPGARSCDQS